MLIKRLILILVILPSFSAFSQLEKGVEASQKEAKSVMKDGDYQLAFDHFRELLMTEPNNTEYNYKAAECILDSDIDLKSKAVSYLEKIKDNEDAPRDILLQLGRAYHQAYKFEEAIKVLHLYEEQNSRDEWAQEQACRYIEMCTIAIDMVKNPLSVKIENLGDDINSEEPDYYAFVDEEETTLYYTTRRSKGNSGYEMVDGYESAEIFMSKEKRGEWGKAKTIGGLVGSTFDEDIVGLSNDGEVLFIYLNTWEISGDLSMATKRGRQFQKPVHLGPNINSPAMETTATISRDQETIYFSSDRNGGYGGFDLYMAKRLPDGTFGLPINMGPNFNGPYDELFPHFSSDEKTFYFSSDGYQTMGDFDIFYCKWNGLTKSWGEPKNMGYPINTPDNDYQISFSQDGRTGYMSALRSEGFGHLDIYKVTFLDVEEKQSVITGKLYTMVPVDYNNYVNYYYYKKGDITRRFTDDFMPPDDSWEKVNEKRDILKPGMHLKIMLTYEKDGESKKFSLDKAPKDDPIYVFKDISVLEVPIKNYVPPKPSSMPAETEVLIKKAYIEINDKNSGTLFGTYVPSKTTGKFVAILPPGKYEILIETEGYKPYKEVFNVKGMGSFKDLMKREILLEADGEVSPVHYSDMPK